MNDDIRNDVNLVIQKVYTDTKGTEDTELGEEEDVIHVHYYPNAILYIKEPGKSTTTNIPIVDSTPKDTEVNQAPMLVAYLTIGIFIFLTLSSILFQLYVLFHPPIATLTIFPKSKPITLTGTLQLGRILNPITVSQSSTAPTTGHGHQDARAATGSITFYNGQLQSVFVPSGTTLTGGGGVQVVTDQDATIPAGNPPSYGQVTVSAHALVSGTRGNVPSYDINQSCCAIAVLAKNTIAFTGGQDERNFQTVTKDDINGVAAILNTTLSASMQGALAGQLKNGEQLAILPCTPQVSADHQAGEEATQVKVTVSETCSAIAYDTQSLNIRVTQLLTAQAIKKLGIGYSLLGDVNVTVNQATVTGSHPTLAFSCSEVWVYALSNQEQRYIKKIIAGKNTQQALQLLSSLPGIERVSLQSAGFGDDTKLPRDISHIHLLIIYGI